MFDSHIAEIGRSTATARGQPIICRSHIARRADIGLQIDRDIAVARPGPPPPRSRC